MRTLAIGPTPKKCQKSVEILKSRGWTAITPVKLDDSRAAYGDIRYVCVMEMPDNEEQKAKQRNRHFNNGSMGYYR